MEQEVAFSKELETLLQYMESLSKSGELGTMALTQEYLALAMLQKRDSMAFQLMSEAIKPDMLDKVHHLFYESLSRKSLKMLPPTMQTAKYNSGLEQILTNAANFEMDALGGEKLNSLHVLLSILSENNPETTTRAVLNKTGLNYSDVLERSKNLLKSIGGDVLELPEPENENMIITADFGAGDDHTGVFILGPQNGGFSQKDLMRLTQDIEAQMKNIMPNNENQGSVLSQVCVNLNDSVKRGEISQLIGRDNEMKQLVNVLARKKKNNAVIVGDEGVGKTALIEGLAYDIVNDNVPTFLLGKEIWSMNFAAMVAGTQYRGVFEKKMLDLFNEIRARKNVILFIDDMSSVFGEKKNSDADIASILNSALLGGSIQIVGTSGFKGYRNTFDSNPSLARRFQKIIISETSPKTTVDILNSLKNEYEDFHKVTFTEEAIKSCVSLAQKYMPERHLPDSAIDIFDECGADVSITLEEPEDIKELKLKVNEAENEIINLKKEDKYDDIPAKTKELGKMKGMLTTEIRKWKNKVDKNRTVIDIDAVCKIVSRKTGIPVNRLSKDDKKNILSMEDTLKTNIIGQDEAISKICLAIKRNRVGLGKKKTMGSFMMLGKTGVGKTLLAKQIAKEVFGDEKYLVRIDMSEYEDKTSVNKLIGASAGYIGYDNGGILTESIKNKKYCVLLLDEFEKATAEVYNLFLQIFDEGFLSDNTGQRIDFKNVIVIMTSNAGAREASELGIGIGFSNEDRTNQILEKELKKRFSPEFLNRLDDIIYFNDLSEDDLRKIVKLELDKCISQIKEIGHDATYDENVINYIFNLLDNKDYGARPIMRLIQKEIENPITDMLLEKDIQAHCFSITVDKDNKLNII